MPPALAAIPAQLDPRDALLLDYQGVLLDDSMPERLAITEADEEREMHEQLLAVIGRAAA